MTGFVTARELDLLLFEMFWKSTVLFFATVVGTRLLRRKSACLRELVFSAGVFAVLLSLIGLLVLPRWTATAPNWLLTLTLENPSWRVVASLDQGSSDLESGAAVSMESISAVPPSDAFEHEGSSLLLRIVPIIWLAGVAIMLGRLLLNLRSLENLTRSSVFPTEGSLANFPGLGRRLTVLMNTQVAVPLTWGILHPIIILPGRFEELSARDRCAVFHHELAHVDRHHFLVRMFAEVVCAMLWFQPLAWVIRRNLRAEQERVCDDRVLLMGEKPSSYARLLLDWQEPASKHDSSLLAIGLTRQGSLEYRLCAILDQTLRRTEVTMSQALAVCLLGLGLAIPVTGVGFSSRALAREGSLADGPSFGVDLRMPAMESFNGDLSESAQVASTHPGEERKNKRGLIHQRLRFRNQDLAITSLGIARPVSYASDRKLARSDTEIVYASSGQIQDRSGRQRIKPSRIISPVRNNNGIIRLNGKQTIAP